MKDKKRNLSARIHEGIKKIYITDELIAKLDKMLATRRCKGIVNDIHRLGINDLLKKYQIPYMRKFGGSYDIRRVITNRLKAKYNVVDYTLIDENNKFAMQNRARRTKLENEHRLFKTVKSPQPKNWTGDQKKYQIKHKGLADYLHRLELHKMSKWDRKHQMPSLELDLFPELIVAGWRTKRMLAQQHIRDLLSIKYCKDKRYKPQWRFFGVYKNLKTGKVFEMEPDPYVIGYPGIRAEAASTTAEIADIISLYKDKVINAAGEGNMCVKVKMYSADGKRFVMRDAA